MIYTELWLDVSEANDLPWAAELEKQLGVPILINGEMRDFPILPFDAAIRIDGDDLVFEGHVDAGGYGHCLVRVPKKHEDGCDKSRYYTLVVQPEQDAPSQDKLLREIIPFFAVNFGVKFRTPEGALLMGLAPFANTVRRKEALDKTLADIRFNTLRIPSLEERGCDRLDFHEIHVKTLRAALEEAFTVGEQFARDQRS